MPAFSIYISMLSFTYIHTLMLELLLLLLLLLLHRANALHCYALLCRLFRLLFFAPMYIYLAYVCAFYARTWHGFFTHPLARFLSLTLPPIDPCMRAPLRWCTSAYLCAYTPAHTWHDFFAHPLVCLSATLPRSMRACLSRSPSLRWHSKFCSCTTVGGSFLFSPLLE